jgi:centractin
VIESGDGVSQSIPIYEGYSIQNGVERSDLGGRDISEYLRLLLRRSGYNFVTSVKEG